METKVVSAKAHWLRTVAVDATLVTLACLIPAVSHALAWPIYKLNPMLALALACVLLSRRDWRNGLLVALLMPLASCLAVGMPTTACMVCMAAELTTVVVLLHLLQPRWAALPAVLTAIVAGKAVYYLLKYALLGTLITTSPWLQLATVLLWGGAYALFNRLGRETARP